MIPPLELRTGLELEPSMAPSNQNWRTPPPNTPADPEEAPESSNQPKAVMGQTAVPPSTSATSGAPEPAMVVAPSTPPAPPPRSSKTPHSAFLEAVSAPKEVVGRDSGESGSADNTIEDHRAGDDVAGDDVAGPDAIFKDSVGEDTVDRDATDVTSSDTAGPAAQPVPPEPAEDGYGGVAEPVREPRPVRPYPRVVAVANQKGGVGKTTSTINLGACMAELGHRTLIVDLDPQANASTGLGIDPRSLELSLYDVILRDVALEDCIEPTAVKNLFLAPSSLDLAGAEIELVPQFSREHKLRMAIEAVVDDYDYVFIDCPPSLGLLTINALTAAKEVCVPIQCEYYALEGLGQLIRNVELVNSSLNPDLEISTIVLVMYDGRTKLAGQVVDEVRGHFGNKVCERVIPRSVRLSEAPSYGQPITTFDSGSKGASAYRDVAKEMDGV